MNYEPVIAFNSKLTLNGEPLNTCANY
jgi:hypothetical protein